MGGDAVHEAVENTIQSRFGIHGRQAADVAAVYAPGCRHPVVELLIVLDVLVGPIGLIDAGVHVAARRVPDAQQLADDGVLVPRLVHREVGLGDEREQRLSRSDEMTAPP